MTYFLVLNLFFQSENFLLKRLNCWSDISQPPILTFCNIPRIFFNIFNLESPTWKYFEKGIYFKLLKLTPTLVSLKNCQNLISVWPSGWPCSCLTPVLHFFDVLYLNFREMSKASKFAENCFYLATLPQYFKEHTMLHKCCHLFVDGQKIEDFQFSSLK